MREKREEEFWQTCIHEAAHGVAAVLFSRSVEFIRVRTYGKQNGILKCNRHPNLDIRRSKNKSRTRQFIKREIMIAFAGVAAESILKGKTMNDAVLGDSDSIENLIRRISSNTKEAVQIGAQLYAETLELIEENWEFVVKVASALQEKKYLKGSEICCLFKKHKSQIRKGGNDG